MASLEPNKPYPIRHEVTVPAKISESRNRNQDHFIMRAEDLEKLEASKKSLDEHEASSVLVVGLQKSSSQIEGIACQTFGSQDKVIQILQNIDSNKHQLVIQAGHIALEQLKKLRPLYLKALSLPSSPMNNKDIDIFKDVLRNYVMGQGGLREIIATFENQLDPTNDSSLARSFNEALIHLLKIEREFMTDVVIKRGKEFDQNNEERMQLIRDLENITLSFTGLMEVGGQFNSTLIFHTLPHSLEVTLLAADAATPDGPSAMLKAAAEGAYHDSRMTYQLDGGFRKMGIESCDCEGASSEALIAQLEQLRGLALTQEEKQARKKGINRTVPNFSTMAPNSLGTVTNATMLRQQIPEIFNRRHLDTHEYKTPDGLFTHLTAMTHEYYSGEVATQEAALNAIEDKLQLLKEFRIGQADISDVLVQGDSWVKSGSLGNWMEIFRQEAYALVNYHRTLSKEGGQNQIDAAIASLKGWITDKQPAFARGMATFREECNYYPMVAMKRALETMKKDGKVLAERITANLQTLEREITIFETLYCARDTTNPAILAANSHAWEIQSIRRDAITKVLAYGQHIQSSSPEAIAQELGSFYLERTGGRPPAAEHVMQQFIAARVVS
jgi:hypothetical protein